MYDKSLAAAAARRTTLVSSAVVAFVAACMLANSARAQLQTYQPPNVVKRISDASEKLELTTNSNRILTLDKPIPRVQVNNPELLAVTPLSATQVQISAKKAGVTQVNLWDEDGNIHSIDIMIYGDAKELEAALQTQFPHSSIKVYRYSESLVLTGFVDNPTHVSQIKLLAEDYAPKVITNINVGGVQQVLLKVKVMEISRTKLKRLGMDFAHASGTGGFVGSSQGGLLSNISDGLGFPTITDTGGHSFEFGVFNGNNAFFGWLDALEKNQVAKILAEPNLVAVSGRPAQFNVGGEIPIVVPQSLGTASIEFKKFGTQVDFLPIVLGNGNIRLECRPRISEIDDSRSVVIDSFVIPALTVREVDTAVEMKASQTFALAGLVQERTETVNSGLPFVKDIPIIGVPFRKTEEEHNEIELLILVTPEFVDPMDCNEVPCGGPGYATTSPERCDLYCAGHVEVPAYCNPIRGPLACGDQCNCNTGNNCQTGQSAFPGSGVMIQGGSGYDSATYGSSSLPATNGGMQPQPMPADAQRGQQKLQPLQNMPVDLPLPSGNENSGAAQRNENASMARGVPAIARRTPIVTPTSAMQQPQQQATAPRPYSPPYQPVYLRNAPSQNNPQATGSRPAQTQGQSGLIGPVGYDAN